MNKLTAAQKKQAEQERVAGLEVENWNLKHKCGTPVTVELDSGETKRTKTRSHAFVANSGHAVIYLEDVSGFYLLSRVKADNEAKSLEAGR